MTDLLWQNARDPGSASTLHEALRALIPLVNTVAGILQHLPQTVPQPEIDTYSAAFEQITRLVNEIIAGSTALSDDGQLSAITSPVAPLPELITEPDAGWEATIRDFHHSLRSSLGLINTILRLVGTAEITEPERYTYLDMLNRNVLSVQSLMKNFILTVCPAAQSVGPESASTFPDWTTSDSQLG